MDINALITSYLNNRHKSRVRVVSWGMVFLLLLWWNQELFRVSVFHPANLILNIFAFVQAIGFYYTFRFVLYPGLKEKKWTLVLPVVAACYVVSLTLLSAPLHINKDIYPEHVFIDIYFNRYTVRAFADFFGQYNFLWYITVSAWCNIFTVIPFVAVNMYRMQQERLISLQARDNMEIEFLRAQVQPHFLFNTLNNIYGLLIDHEKESQIVLKLSDLMRYSLYDCQKESVPLCEEIGFIRQYLHLERARLRKQEVYLQYTLPENIDEKTLIAPLVLPQFIESVIGVLIERKYANSISVRIGENCQNVSVIMVYNIDLERDSALDQDDLPVDWVRQLELECPQKYAINLTSDNGKNSISLDLEL